MNAAAGGGLGHDVAMPPMPVADDHPQFREAMRGAIAHLLPDAELHEATIKAHMTAILRKLGASNRTQAVLIAGRLAVGPDSVVAPPDEAE